MIIISVTCRAGVTPVSTLGLVCHDVFKPHRLRKLNINFSEIDPAILMAFIRDPEVIDVTITKPLVTKKFFDTEREYYDEIARDNERQRIASDQAIRAILDRKV